MKSRKRVKGEESVPQSPQFESTPVQPSVAPDVQTELQPEVLPEEQVEMQSKIQPEPPVPAAPRKLEVPRVNKRGARSRLALIAVMLGIVGIVIGGIFTYQYMISPERMAKKAAAKNVALLEEVGTHMLLPENETPVIYEVQDPELLSAQQPFFKGAEAGDSLIVFPQSAKAIIYSSKRGLIVNVGPVSFDESSLQKR